MTAWVSRRPNINVPCENAYHSRSPTKFYGKLVEIHTHTPIHEMSVQNLRRILRPGLVVCFARVLPF